MTAALFDIDGTLVDSNYLHVEAWERALADVGKPVDSWRIHRAIGMDSDKLMDELLGDAKDELGDRASELHSTYYSTFTDRLRPFAGARDLLRAIAAKGVQVILATSAPDDEFEILNDVIDADDAISAHTTSGDVENAKPDPDIIQVALKKGKVDAAEAIMIGDSIWDVHAARRAGVDCIGLLSGGISVGELKDAGAVAVYRDTADLLDQLDSSPLSRLFS